jgi:hypothetical protein
MYEEYFERGQCDHDDEVMCHSVFFDHTTRGHLARARFKAMLQANTHWVVGVTPECASYALRLERLHWERCYGNMITLHIHDLRRQPLLCTLPKAHVSLDDILQIIGAIAGWREVIEDQPWILLTSVELEATMQAVDRWINADNLLN